MTDSPSAETPLLCDIHGDCAVLTLNRPAVLNALSHALRGALIERLQALAGDSQIRAVILTGAGRAFTAGLDLDEIARSGTTVQDAVADQDIGAAIAGFPKPLIGAINGLAITGGLEIALACDMLVATESARFADTHVRVGILPGWGLSQRLSRAVGIARAKELSLSGRFFSAVEAERWGLVNRVVADGELLGAALAMAREITENEPASVAALKALIDTGYAMAAGDAVQYEAQQARRENAGVTAQDVLNRAEAARVRSRISAAPLT